jgi:hypothetical protein
MPQKFEAEDDFTLGARSPSALLNKSLFSLDWMAKDVNTQFIDAISLQIPLGESPSIIIGTTVLDGLFKLIACLKHFIHTFFESQPVFNHVKLIWF